MQSEALAHYLGRVGSYPRLEVAAERTADRVDLITSNLRLVVHIAKGYARNGDELLDRIQDGNVGLCKAADAFDADRGAFAAYAGLRIRAEIRSRRVDRLGKPLRHRSGCDLTSVGLDDSPGTHVDPFDAVNEELALEAALQRLPPVQREVLAARLSGATLQEIATVRDVSHQYIREVERAAVAATTRGHDHE